MTEQHKTDVGDSGKEKEREAKLKAVDQSFAKLYTLIYDCMDELQRCRCAMAEVKTLLDDDKTESEVL